jgi:hypothetical protein
LHFRDQSQASQKKYPNAVYRILVISDGEDVGSRTKAHEVCTTLLKKGVIVDAVIVSSTDSCKLLTAICHVTRGLAFRPASIEEGLALFEQEAFLQYSRRRKPPKSNGKMDEAVLDALAEKATCDQRAESQDITAALSKQPLAIPKLIAYQNRDQEVPDARRRRILKELHSAAVIQDPRPNCFCPPGFRLSEPLPSFRPYLVIAEQLTLSQLYT